MALETQFGVVDESVYGTPVVTTRFFEYDEESIADDFRRTSSNALRSGQAVERVDRFTPWNGGGAGSVTMEVLTKSFAWWFKHMFGTVATSGPDGNGAYTHTGTVVLNNLLGKFFTAQVNRPLHPAGTNQAFTCHGGKVTSWEIANSVDGHLMATLDLDFEEVETATGLAVASYPTGMLPLSWVGGVATIGGTQFDFSEVGIKVSNGLNVDRRYARANPLKKEPVEAERRVIEFSIKGDFSDLTQRNRVASSTAAGAVAALVASWTGPVAIGGAVFPKLTLTIPEARFDKWESNNSGADPLEQTLTGVGLQPVAGSPITGQYISTDVTP